MVYTERRESIMTVKSRRAETMLRRRRAIGILFLAVLAVAGVLCGLSISSAFGSEDPPPAGSILFFVRDSKTYLGLPNATIEVYEEDKLITTITADETGHVRFDAKRSGTYITIVKAEGYRSLEGKDTLTVGGRAFEQDVMLPRLTPLKDPDYFPTQQLNEDAKSKGDVIFRAFIIDKKSGKPVEGVRVRAVNAGAEGRSDERGIVTLRYPAPPQPADPDEIPPLENYIFEKPGYRTEEYQNEFAKPGVTGTFVDMEHGSGRQIHKNPDRRLQPPHPEDPAIHEFQQRQMKKSSAVLSIETAQALGGPGQPLNFISPSPNYSTIIIGTNCNSGAKSCTGTVRQSLEEYVQQGLHNECPDDWSPNALRACAVSYRGTAAWFIKYFRKPTGTCPTCSYDICNTDTCQVWKAGTVQPTAAAATAARYTSGFMIESNGGIQKAEHATENNDRYGYHGCEDGQVGRPAEGWTCLVDNSWGLNPGTSHGRGLSQRGAQR